MLRSLIFLSTNNSEAVSVVASDPDILPDVIQIPDDWDDDEESVVLMDHDDDDAKWLMGFTENEHR
jgi:hypothetical protein